MEISVAQEIFIFLSSMAAGGAICLLYDLFRVMRLQENVGQMLIHVQDLVFWLLAFGIMFFVVFFVNNGTLRFYEFLGAFSGAFLYEIFLSSRILKLLGFAVTFFSKIFKVFLKILLTPLAFMYNIVYRCICIFLRPILRFGRALLRRIQCGIRQATRMLRRK